MRQTEQKALDYLKSNPIVAEFIEKLNETRKEYYEKAGMPNQYKEVIVEVGNKFIRIWPVSYTHLTLPTKRIV